MYGSMARGIPCMMQGRLCSAAADAGPFVLERHSQGREDNGDTSGDDGTSVLARKRSSYHLTNSHAAVELFLRLNHARQTMDFAKRQVGAQALSHLAAAQKRPFQQDNLQPTSALPAA